MSDKYVTKDCGIIKHKYDKDCSESSSGIGIQIDTKTAVIELMIVIFVTYPVCQDYFARLKIERWEQGSLFFVISGETSL